MMHGNRLLATLLITAMITACGGGTESAYSEPVGEAVANAESTDAKVVSMPSTAPSIEAANPEVDNQSTATIGASRGSLPELNTLPVINNPPNASPKASRFSVALVSADIRRKSNDEALMIDVKTISSGPLDLVLKSRETDDFMGDENNGGLTDINDGR